MFPVVIHHEMKILGFFLLWCLVHVDCLEEEDDCKLATGQKGKCTNIHSCTYAKSLLKNNENPGFCGFQGNDPLVCCTEDPSTSPRAGGVLAAEKCLEYYRYKRYFILIGSAKPSLVKEFPHMAAIGYGEKDDIQWLCGGSLISYKFVLTAAHCLRSSQFGDAKYVRLGDLDLAIDTDDAAPQDYTVQRIYPHPEYKRPSRYHDIGLIELDREVNLTSYVAIACLDTRREHNETQMIVTGWGRTAFIGNFSTFLLKANFDIVPQDVCNPSYQRIDKSVLEFGILDDNQICAGGANEQDTCQGDSGGPLQIINEERSSGIIVYDIVGITSFGKACGISQSPGVYTRVYNYLSWIENIVWSS